MSKNNNTNSHNQTNQTLNRRQRQAKTPAAKKNLRLMERTDEAGYQKLPPRLRPFADFAQRDKSSPKSAPKTPIASSARQPSHRKTSPHRLLPVLRRADEKNSCASCPHGLSLGHHHHLKNHPTHELTQIHNLDEKPLFPIPRKRRWQAMSIAWGWQGF